MKILNSVRANISKIANGSASPNNTGLSRLINGSQKIQGDYQVFHYGLKHLAAEIFYRDKLISFIESIKEGKLEDSVDIYKTVPAFLRQAFNEYAELDSFILSGKPAEKIKMLSNAKQKVTTLFASFISGVKEKISALIPNGKKEEEAIKTAFSQSIYETMQKTKSVSLSGSDKTAEIVQAAVLKPSSTIELEKMAADNEITKFVIELYRQQGINDDKILKVLNARINGIPTGDKFYRYIGQSELEKLLNGEHVTSTRPCHKGIVTDVTTNPDYGRIPTSGSYRITFKDKPEFNIAYEGKCRIAEKDLLYDEYHLNGGYGIGDIEKIEQKTGDGFRPVWQSKN